MRLVVTCRTEGKSPLEHFEEWLAEFKRRISEAREEEVPEPTGNGAEPGAREAALTKIPPHEAAAFPSANPPVPDCPFPNPRELAKVAGLIETIAAKRGIDLEGVRDKAGGDEALYRFLALQKFQAYVTAVERNLIKLPESRVMKSEHYKEGWCMWARPALREEIVAWHENLVTIWQTNGGSGAPGKIAINSAYRRLGTTCADDLYGKRDAGDEKGHWNGLAIDISAKLTADSFTVPSRKKVTTDDVRDAAYDAGLDDPYALKGDDLERYESLPPEEQKKIMNEKWHYTLK